MVSQLPGKMAYFKVQQQIDNLSGNWSQSSLSDFVFQETVAAVLSKISSFSGRTFDSVVVMSVVPYDNSNASIASATTATTPATPATTATTAFSLSRSLRSLRRHLQQGGPVETESVLVDYIINYRSVATAKGDMAIADTLINALNDAVRTGKLTGLLNMYAANVHVYALETATATKEPYIYHTPVAYTFTRYPTGTQTRAPATMNWSKLVLICIAVVASFGGLALCCCGCIMLYHRSHKDSKAAKYKVWDEYQTGGKLSRDQQIRRQNQWNSKAAAAENEKSVNPSAAAFEMAPPSHLNQPSHYNTPYMTSMTHQTVTAVLPSTDGHSPPGQEDFGSQQRATLSAMDFGFYAQEDTVFTGASGGAAASLSSSTDVKTESHAGSHGKNKDMGMNPLRKEKDHTHGVAGATSHQKTHGGGGEEFHNPMLAMNKGFK
jgi:hypothetical protein